MTGGSPESWPEIINNLDEDWYFSRTPVGSSESVSEEVFAEDIARGNDTPSDIDFLTQGMPGIAEFVSQRNGRFKEAGGE